MAKQNFSLAAFAAAIALASCSAIAAETPDLILRHGTILDGSGAPRFQGDVAVTGGRISQIGDLSNVKARQEIDATGLFVTPGFINIHDHSQIDGVVKAENMLTQGVTTEIINP